jgi:hypothetical protein
VTGVFPLELLTLRSDIAVCQNAALLHQLFTAKANCIADSF